MRIFLLAIFLIGASASAQSQPVNLGDSLRHYFQEEGKFIIRIDTRNSFITGRTAQIRGIKAGISYGDRLSIGIGYNWLKKGFDQNLNLGPDDNQYSVNSQLHFMFISPFAEYVFYVKRGFSVAIPIQIGLGTSWLSYNDIAGNKARTDRKFIMLYEPAMTVEQKFLKYFAVGGGIGYRLMLKNNKEVDARFTSPIYLIRLRILFLEIYNNITNRSSVED